MTVWSDFTRPTDCLDSACLLLKRTARMIAAVRVEDTGVRVPTLQNNSSNALNTLTLLMPVLKTQYTITRSMTRRLIGEECV